MANLNYFEKRKLENFLRMGGGFVLDFNNSTFREFILDAVGIDIYEAKYEHMGCSKANRLRCFWEIETNVNVAKLIEHFSTYYRECNNPDLKQDLDLKVHDECLQIAMRLRADLHNSDIEAIQANDDCCNFEKLASSIREDITNDKPDVALDRLHTYLGKYCRQLCDKRGISYDNSRPLNSIFGGYVKHLRESEYIESEMTIRILNTSIAILEQFNDVRNNKSFAHPNNLLNYHESLLIFKYVSSLVVFLDALEIKIDADSRLNNSQNAKVVTMNVIHGDLPF